RVLFLGRLPVILLGLLLGGMLVQWSRTMWGKTAAMIAVVLYALSPNWLGIISLATTDGPLTVTFFTAVFTLWHYQKRPSRARWLLAGIGLGLALSSKITALLLIPVTFVLLFSQWRWGDAVKRPFLRALSLLPLALLVLWACYRFEFGPVAGLPVSVPAPTYVSNFVTVQDHVEESHNTFLLGERARKGWWYYFIIAFLIKTPVPVLLLLLGSVILILWQRTWRSTMYLWFPAGALFAAASVTGLNIGYRHILPALPFVWMLVAYAGCWGIQYKGTKEQRDKEKKKNSLPALRWIVLLALIWYVWGGVRQHPHYLAYFNEIVGDSANGYKYLSDSNIDWGQDLYLLVEYAAKSDVPIRVSYNGVENVARYDDLVKLSMDLESGLVVGLNPANPAPGRYAISVTHLHGTQLREPDIFDWFRRQTPVAQLGYSIFIYDVPEAATGSWVGHCLAPTPAIDPVTAEGLVGQSGLRHLYFDCSSSWIFPANGAAGWVVVPPHTAETFSLPLSVQPKPVFVHAATNATPAYDVLYWPGGIDVAAEIAAWPGTVSLANGEIVERPFSIDNIAQFLGYQDNGDIWSTAWQVEQKPTAPLSIIGHLLDVNAAEFVADGLGFSSEQWQSGDVVVQQHEFVGEGTAVSVTTGLYEYLSGNQLPLVSHPDTTFQLLPAP
ncbi:MAG: glycosyltransferase family 39 protein, partial [Anaerolineales bacterium]|nr:glycosyltransferase family 39 protein [Anaerolineales bacterium]